MTIRRFRSHGKLLAAMLSIACFLSFEVVAAVPAFAAEPAKPPVQTGPTWETWPRAPGTPTPSGPADAGEIAGEKTYAGLSAGTWGWIAGGVAVVGVAALALGGGGGGGSSAPAH
jgi:hypothetical protein